MDNFDTKAFASDLSQGIVKGLTPLLMQLGQAAAGQKATIGTPGHNYPHGTGGYLYGDGIDPDVVATTMAWRGIGELLRLEPRRTIETLKAFITGVEATSSTERSTTCGDCISGETEACIQAFPTGLVCRETKDMTPNRIIERLNNGDIDLQLLNDAYGGVNSPWFDRSIGQFNLNDILQIATSWALLYELPPLFQSALAPMVYSGNPTNNNGDAYREFRGLDLLINTGFVDAIENVTCPALDSDVKDFNYTDVASGTVNGRTFYEFLEMVEYYVRHNAIRQGLMPADWVISMRPELWQVLSSIVPLQAIQAAIMSGSTTNLSITMDGATMVSERDRMRSEMMLPLNGRTYRVVEDDGITELNNANDANLDPGEYASDVYFVPTTYLGNRPGTYIEHKDFRFLTGELAATADMIGDFYRWSGNGFFMYSWVKDGKCFKIQSEVEPRVILRVPQLAGRIQNVKYVPLQHLRSPDPDSPYFAKGGVSTRTPPTRYYP